MKVKFILETQKFTSHLIAHMAVAAPFDHSRTLNLYKQHRIDAPIVLGVVGDLGILSPDDLSCLCD